jgi:hypothetical protein
MNSALRIAARFTKGVLWSAALFTSQLVFAQGVHIVKRAHISPSTGTNHYSDVVGESRSNGKSYAYVSSWHNTSGVWIFDVTNPDAPVFLTKYANSMTTNMQGIEVDKGIGYFGDDSGYGIHIVDLSNPAKPVLITRITSAQGGYNSVHDLTLDGNGHMFVPNYRVNDDVQIWNVSNPAVPTLQMTLHGTDTLSVHDVTVANNRLFMNGWGGQVDIWDITNLDTQAPQMLGSFFSGLHTQDTSLTTDGKFLACPRETAGNGDVGIFDISNPANVVRVATITESGWGINATSPSTSKIMGNLLFVAWYQSGLMVFDISTPSNPILVGNYDTWSGFSFGGSGGGDGDWGVWPFLGLDRVLVSDRTTGLYIFDVTGWSTQPGVFSLNYSPSSLLGSLSTTGTVGLVGIPSSNVAVNFSSSDASVNPSPVSISAGAHVASFSQSTSPVTSTTNVNVTANDGTFSTAATITVLPPQPSSVLVSPNPVRGGLNATGKVTLTGPVQTNTPVALAVLSGNSAIASMPTSVMVPAGFSSATWTIQTNQMSVSTRVKISATLNGVTKTAFFTVSAITPSALSFSPTSVAGGGTTTGKVSFPAVLVQNTVVSLAVVSGSAAVTSIPATVTVPAGSASATFVANTSPVSATTTVKISATANGGTKSATFNVF